MSEQQQTEDKVYPWMEGVPTKPDVDALLKAFPIDEIIPGKWRVTDDAVREHIGQSNQSRFRTVTDAWRRRLKNDFSINVYRQESTGFFCPTPEEVFANTHPTYEQAGRKLKRQMRDVAIVKPENEAHRAVQDHQGRLLHATVRSLKKDRMNVLPSTVVKETPQIGPRKSHD